jgi:hypothetical protein
VKKALTTGLIGLLLIGTIASLAPGQTAKDVLDKMFEAQGGRKALAAVKDSTISGSLEMNIMGMTMSGTVTIHQKEPDKMRMDMAFSVQGMDMTISQACDGEKAWTTDPQSGSVQALTGKQLEDMKKQALGTNATLHPDKYGISFAFKGKEKIEAKEYLVLEQMYKDGQKITMYIDPATYLIFKTKGPGTDPQTGAEVEAETFFSEYKKVGEITMAHVMSIHQSGAEFLRMTFAKIALNTNLDDGIFSLGK